MEITLSPARNITKTPSMRVKKLVDSFLEAQDVKPSSRAQYRRTLKQYFTWVEKKGYLLSQIARPQRKKIGRLN